MAYDLRHTGEAIDAAVYAVERGSVVTENTAKEVTLGEAKPASADAIAKELQKKVDKVEGKGLSTNDYTNEEMAQVAENKENIAKNAEDIEAHRTALTEHDVAIAANTEAIERKAEKNGRYSKLTSGFAENIVGDGSATEEVIGFRPTASEERNVANTTYIDGERNEAARMTYIKGNSEVWNQKIQHRIQTTWPGIGGWYVRMGTATATFRSDGYMSCVIQKIDSSLFGVSQKVFENHKYYVTVDYEYSPEIYELENTAFIRLIASSDAVGNSLKLIANNYQTKNVTIGQFTMFFEGDSNYPYLLFDLVNLPVESIGKGYFVNARVRVYDLTQMFGAGNEPTTVEEFYQRMPVGVDINAYNEGEIIDGNYNALRSTAFNQFNGTYAKVLAGVTYHVTGDITSIGFTTEEGGATEAITLDNGKYTPTQNGYIYATGENICIHLCWSEYAHMEDMYEAYKPFVRDLSFIKKYFPNGMRSVGNVRDEIRYNATEERWEAVQNVGVRAYASGDESNTAVTTDGKNTNYALATPKVTEITEDITLDYDCSDYGTEELISEGVSAPLVADVVYAPNAISTLKQVPDILRRLAILEAKAMESANVTIEE